MVYFLVYLLKKKIIYTNCYPRGLFFIDFKKEITSKKRNLEICLKLEKKKVLAKSKRTMLKN